MAYVCELTGKKKLRGNRVSHANNKTIHYQQPNLQIRAFFVPELGSTIRLRVSTNALRTVNKHGGLSRFLINAPIEALSEKAAKAKRSIQKRGLK